MIFIAVLLGVNAFSLQERSTREANFDGNILYQNKVKGKSGGSTKNVKTLKKVTGFFAALIMGEPCQCRKYKGFAHYPHSFPHGYVNAETEEIGEKVAKNGSFEKFIVIKQLGTGFGMRSNVRVSRTTEEKLFFR